MNEQVDFREKRANVTRLFHPRSRPFARRPCVSTDQRKKYLCFAGYSGHEVIAALRIPRYYAGPLVYGQHESSVINLFENLVNPTTSLMQPVPGSQIVGKARKLERERELKTRGIWRKGGGDGKRKPPRVFCARFLNSRFPHYTGTWNRLL